MTRYFVGGEMDAFTPSDGAVYEVTTAGSFVAPFARCAIRCGTALGQTAPYAEANHANLTTFWLRFDVYMLRAPAAAQVYTLLSAYNSGGTEVFRLTAEGTPGDTGVSSARIKAYIWSGSAFVQVGTGLDYDVSTVTTFNLNLVAGTGAFAIYLAGSLRDSGTGAAFSNICKERFRAVYVQTYWSQVIVGDASEIGNFLYRYPIDTAGTNTAWTGGPSDINETVYADATFISSTSNGDIETNTANGLDLSAYTIQAVAASARANCGATGPQNLQLAVRTGGTNYFSASILQAAGYAVAQKIWETSPNTAAQWTAANAQAAELGVKAIT